MKAPKRKTQPQRWASLLKVGQAVRITKVDCPTLLLNDVKVGDKGIVVDIPNDGTIEVYICDYHQGWFFTEDELAPWKEYTQNVSI